MSYEDRYRRGGDNRYGYGYERGRDYGRPGSYRRGSGQEGYGERRDWTDRAEDEVKSWFGDDDAERRRRVDERSGYGRYGRADDYGSRGDWGHGSDYGRRYGSEGYGRDYGYGDESRGGYARDYGYGSRGRTYGGYGEFAEGDYGRGAYGREGYGGYGRDRDYRGSSSYGRDYGREREGYRGEERGFFERAADEVASWFGDEEAARRRQMDYRGRGPKGYTRSDDRIREDVNDRLSDDWSLDASDVEVSVSSGEVTLSGTVNSRQDKRRAEDIAESVSGVQNVQNNLRVRQQGTSGTWSGSTGTGTSGTTATSGTAASGTGATGTSATGTGSTGTSGSTGTGRVSVTKNF